MTAPVVNYPFKVPELRFETGWADAQTRVAAVLRSRGLQPSDIEDILQDVAVRALRRYELFESEEHLVRWACRVAMNLHVDATRRARRLSTEPLPDVPSGFDTARAAERRLDLATLAAGIAELDSDDQRVLLDPAPTASRREAVRLAVRRHRIRARLASLIEGVVVGVPVLRRVLRSLSTPAKAGIAAVPVVLVTAALLVGPSLDNHTTNHLPSEPDSSAADAPAARHPVELIGTKPAPVASAPRSAPSARQAAARAAAPAGASAPQTIARVNTPVLPVAVTKEHLPDDQPTACFGGVVNLCVDRPGPTIPHPDVPLL